MKLHLAAIFLLVLFSCSKKKEADLLVLNAKIYTADSLFTIHQAMAIKDEKIIALGSTEEILRQYNSSARLDGEGRPVFPGFNDAHCHFTGMATDRWKCDLTGTNSFREVLDNVNAYARNAKTEWIYGRGWDQNDWAEKTYPDKSMLDSLFPDRPVFLKRVDGHAALVNQAALDLAGINDTTEIAGGSFEKKDGKLTGILIDKAMEMVDNIIPGIPDELALEYFEEVQRLCLAVGLTTVQDCGISEHTLELLQRFEENQAMKIKVFALLSDSAHYYDKWIKKGIYHSPLLTMGGFKIYADGALGSRGACLLRPYSDKPGWSGFMLSNPDSLKTIAAKLANSPFQMCTHAIGDSANRAILNLYGEALTEKPNRRWRIEHAQVVNEKDFALFKKFDVVPSVQPTHATSDMYWAGERLGPSRLKHAYAYRDLLNIYGWLPLGTDFPVEDISPIKTFYAAVARKDALGFPPGGFQKENALTREQALKGITIWAAKAAFQEKEKGSLEVGKSADFLVLDRDIMECEENAILTTRVMATFINGKKVFGK
ncbi:MAG: amidohydrolase [Chitinophagaceae bacterium]|nr:MAG: amidohydrolase [Chitinophagaceae bacterium]